MDTIAAIATPPGVAAIAIVRISGEDTLKVLEKVFVRKKGKGRPPSHKVILGYIVDPETHSVIDEVLLTFMKSPRSYTGEDMAEISCHGGKLVPKLVLRAVLKAGARLAEPGEFTKRAFLNGKMDLIRARGVLEIIEAETEKAVLLARERLLGHTSEKLAELRENYLSFLKDLEARIDFEEDVPQISEDYIGKKLQELRENLENLIKTGEANRYYFEGARIAILGKPNVGKSTLFNDLLGQERAIVTEEAGTTRDIISESVIWNGIPLTLYDTAGVREAEGKVESIGIERALELSKRADLRLLLIDCSSPLTSEDMRLLETVEKPRIIVLNKIDLGEKIKPGDIKGETVVEVSALKGTGVSELRQKIMEFLERPEVTGTIAFTRREGELLREALRELKEGTERWMEGFPLDILSFHVRKSLEKLELLLGISDIPEETLSRIFSEFCIGK
ncbi:MAG: tRNA uridine-5-carboxymethylaminomethyl(34) synthesis GTPase MnmE [Candidatus Hydrothermota bacterium]|nr:MAG: tRNA uridine-5-carboxymethylaminomethyl(34) synthesis GTPase MnmE [Candidatus Hydrothermae bacterium]